MITDGVIPGSNSAAAWQNPANPFDVDNNGSITSRDALLIINRLGRSGSSLPLANGRTDRYFDVTGDGRMTALDALRVVNEITRSQASSESLEPESHDEAVMGNEEDWLAG